ncbi:hypothetical protein [Streptomyces sp. Root264]|uniref:hypothetical protein n=1 Tax=Streptomyces sp. Root264 TaxID=1736503 RepID=UPI00070E66D7|nr:hypothetical protein [Streptomyces sp. Root264]KRD23354.1 hypothetical protein ASE41_10210 [Streptomyces sp. Root264]
MHEPLKAVALTVAVAGVLLAAPMVSIVAARAAAPVHMDDGAAPPDIVDRHDGTGCRYDNADEFPPRAARHPDGTTETVTWATAGEDTVVIRPGNATGLPCGCWWSPDEAALHTAGDRPMMFVEVTRTERSPGA